VTDSTPLRGRRVVILVEQEYDHVDLDAARTALTVAGATVHIVGPIQGHVYRSRDGQQVIAEFAASAIRAVDVDAVVIPGGFAPDRIRLRHAMVDLVRDTVEAGKPVAAIDHGPSVLINAKALSGRMVTCWPSIAVDAKNAGARYVDRPVVEDGCVITSRKSDDLPFFTEAIIRQLVARSV
jgi:protease I